MKGILAGRLILDIAFTVLLSHYRTVYAPGRQTP
jgi:hypothetical protein